MKVSGTEMALAAVSAMANNVARIRALESELASETAWAKHYHDCCIAIRDALPDIIENTEWAARYDDTLREPLKKLADALAAIDSPTIAGMQP